MWGKERKKEKRFGDEKSGSRPVKVPGGAEDHNFWFQQVGHVKPE